MGPVYFDFQVAQQASKHSSVLPEYPKALKRAHISGTVMAQFVVDTTGRADPSTIVVLRSTHPLFALAVRDAIVKGTFNPATIAGHRVRQLVQEPFGFQVR
jgi:protein TonB